MKKIVGDFIWICRGYWGTWKDMAKAGFEPLFRIGNSSFAKPSCFYIKNSLVFYNKGFNPEKSMSIELIDVNEITQNARLVELEIRYRMNGTVRSERISGTTEQLLAAEDKLGYLS